MTKQKLHIYTRVSTQVQQEEGTSLETQQELGIKKAEELGFDHKVWNEGGASSNYEHFQNRPVLLKLLSEIDAGNIKHLWVYNNDRLSRHQTTQQTIRIKLQDNAVTLYTSNGRFDLNDPHDNFLKTILDGVAQLDNAQRAERTRIGKMNRVKQGYWMGGPPPFGYQIKNRKLELHPEESEWVRKIYEWYSKDKPIKWIKSGLDKAGVKTRRGNGLWTLGSIQKILKNSHPTGSYTYVDSKTEETIQCSCPSIISKSLWNKCQEKRKAIFARRGQNNRTKRFYLLRNLLFCGHCGSPMSGRIKEDKNEYLYYCPRKERDWKTKQIKAEDKWKRNTGCTMTRSLNIRETDKLVTSEFLKILLDPKRINNLIHQDLKAKQNSSVSDDETELKKLQIRKRNHSKEAEDLISSIAQIETEKLMKKKDERIADQILENLNTALQETENKIKECDAQIHRIRHKEEIAVMMRNLEYKPQKITANIDPKQMQAHLNALLERIEASYDKDHNEHQLVLHFKLPLVNGSKDMPLQLKKNKKAA